MRVETQLSAFLENRAGALGRVAADLAKHGIGIRGMTIANLADHAVVRLVVTDAHKALHLLGERGVLVVTSDVLAIELPDEAGALATVARQLARDGINIDYAYGSGPDDGRAVYYFHVSDLTKARAALARQTPRRASRRRK